MLSVIAEFLSLSLLLWSLFIGVNDNAPPLFGSIGGYRKDEDHKVISAGWHLEGNPAAKALLHMPPFHHGNWRAV